MNIKNLKNIFKKQLTNIVFILTIGFLLILLRLITLEQNNFLFALELTYGFILLILIIVADLDNLD